MEISIHQLHERHMNLKPDEMILDVRNPDEFATGHITGATNIPLANLENRSEDLLKKTKIYIHCKAGGRARQAYETLQAIGLRNVVCVTEGMDTWIESGYNTNK